MSNPNAIANLTPFRPGHNSPRSAASLRALTKCRKLSPETVDFLVSVMRNPLEPTPVRVKCAEIILDKALPSPRVRNDETTTAQDDGHTRHLVIEFVGSSQPIILNQPRDAPAYSNANGHDSTPPIDIVFVKPEEC